jgi:tRNA(Ile)-lysidine synthase
MREQVLAYIRRQGLLKPGDRVLIAVSGGADSVALLRVLLELRTELGIVLAAAHLNHGLRGEDSDADEHFVEELARRHELDFVVERIAVAEYAAGERMGLEAAGRELRYQWLANVAVDGRFDAVATAHTLDDQAETVLMKFLRGAGSRGLAGIYPLMVRDETKTRFVRPLLGTTRNELEMYLKSLVQDWREDESNLERRFLRNRVRHELLPLLDRDYNPSIREVLSGRAEISRAEEEYWDEAVRHALKNVVTGEGQLRLREFAELAVALQRRVLKYLVEEQGVACDSQHVEAVRQCALGELPRLELPGNWVAVRLKDRLTLQPQRDETPKAGYSYELAVPGEVELAEIECMLRIVPVPAAFAEEAAPGTLLRNDLAGGEVCIRNWQAGDRFHVAYTGKEQKLKTLFLERKVPAPARRLWPVLLKGADILWARGFPVANAYCWRPGDGDALRVECVPGSRDPFNHTGTETPRK